MGRLRVVDAINQEIKSMGERGATLQLRLFAFFLLFVVAMMSGVTLILFLSGTLSAGRNETQVWLGNEIRHLSGDVSGDFGKLSLDGVSLSVKLCDYLDGELQSHGLAPAELQSSPELFSGLLSGSYDYLAATLEKSRASGAFIILDATVNPALPGAERSRAGLYIKNMEPNVVSAGSPSFHFMRGPMAIAKEKGISVLPQWQMEIKTEEGGMFETVLDAARANDLAVSRLYYWQPRTVLEGDYGSALFLCVPLVAEDKTVIGICGLDVSAQLFKMQYSPDNATYTRAFAVLAPLTPDGGLDASGALFAGNYTITPSRMADTMSITGDGIYEFRSADGAAYDGVYGEIRLYPADSAFAGCKWALAVLMPREDFDAFVSARSRSLSILITFLFALSLLAAIVLSRRYLSPVLKALRMIRESGAKEYERTRIPEIDDLIEFLSSHDAEREKSAPSPQRPQEAAPASSAMYDAFISKIATLSPAERAVFNLYLEGCDARQIADTLYLSINTIKTHNKRIYMKLDITSRKELMVYAEMMHERGDAQHGGQY